jgi:hypothetical protein
MTKELAFAIWGLIFLIGLLILSLRLLYPPQPIAVAAKQIAANHLIQPDDLESPSPTDAFIRHYARSNIASGQILGPNDVSTVPLLATLPKPLFAVATQPDLVAAGSVDVKTSGKICNKDGPAGDAEVIAVFCSAAKNSRYCMALVDADPALGPKLKPNQSMFLPDCSNPQPQK